MLVGIEGDRSTMIFEIKLQRLEIAERTFLAHETQLHQLAGRIIDEHQQRAWITAILEPAVLRCIDLHQLALGLASQSWLVDGALLLARQPKSGLRHPFAQGLARHQQAIALGKLLCR